MVLTIGIGPFAQLLLSFENCLLPTTSSQASRPVQRMYLGQVIAFKYNKFEDTMLGYQIYATGTPSQEVQDSVYAGIFAPQTSVTKISCPSGNCIFPENHHILGFFGSL